MSSASSQQSAPQHSWLAPMAKRKGLKGGMSVDGDEKQAYHYGAQQPAHLEHTSPFWELIVRASPRLMQDLRVGRRRSVS